MPIIGPRVIKCRSCHRKFCVVSGDVLCWLFDLCSACQCESIHRAKKKTLTLFHDALERLRGK